MRQQLAFAGVEVAPPPPPPPPVGAQKWAIGVLETLPVSTTSLTSKGLLVIQIAQVDGWDAIAYRLIEQGFKRDPKWNYSKTSSDKDRAITWWAGFVQSWDDVAARAAAEAETKRAAEAAAPVEPPEVRVWIFEREWDRLDAETRTEFEEPIGGSGVDWEGREGWVTALVPDDEVLVALRGIAEGAEVKLCVGEEMPTAPVKAARGRKSKVAR